jgi:aryl-alcohol dehydrogenase
MRATAAVVTRAGGPFEFHEIDLDDPRDDELIVEVDFSGMCHTDLIGRAGGMVPFPAVFGHEGVGTVVARGSAVAERQLGDLVLMSEHFCAQCDRCRVGLTPYCRNPYGMSGGVRSDGSRMLSSPALADLAGAFLGQSSFATHVLTKARNTVAVPGDLDLYAIAPMGCAGMTGAGSVFKVLEADAGSSIVIFGAGAVGLNALLAARVAGCDPIIMVDVVPSRLQLALQLGADKVINARTQDPVDAVRAVSTRGADLVLEASGAPEAGLQAVRSTRQLGRCAIVGMAPPGTTIEVSWDALLGGRTLLGAVMGASDPRELIPQLIQLYRTERFNVGPMIEVFPFEEINTAAEASTSGEVIKPVLAM